MNEFEEKALKELRRLNAQVAPELVLIKPALILFAVLAVWFVLAVSLQLAGVPVKVHPGKSSLKGLRDRRPKPQPQLVIEKGVF